MSDPGTPAPDVQSVPGLERGGPSTIPIPPPANSATQAPRTTFNPRGAVPRAERRLTAEELRAALNWTSAVARVRPSRIRRRRFYSHGTGFARDVHRQESRAMRRYNIMNWVVNGLLITQAAVSAVLISLGSTGNMYRVQIAVLGGVNGITTGALSIIKGQGLPNRYWQYASGLRSVGLKIEELERKVQADIVVTQEDLERLLQMYEDVQHQYAMNNPDVWKNITDLLQPSRSEGDARHTHTEGAVEGVEGAEGTEGEGAIV